MLAELEFLTGGFLAGGLASSRGPHLHIAGNLESHGISGAVFSPAVSVASALTQGCAPLGPEHTITRCDGNIVMELDGLPAFDVFSEDLRKMASERTGLAPEKVKISRRVRDEDEDGDAAAKGGRPPEFHAIGAAAAGGDLEQLFRGEVHVAFPVPGTDRQDYLVRNALGLDPEKGWVAVSHRPSNGDRMLFVHRDDASVRADLMRMLLSLRRRVRGENNGFAPRGAVYISCVARTQTDFGDGGEGDCGEMRLVREVMGDIPLAGFYANGEISNRRLYGYTGVLILFL
jgi:small ligand-binding sensory domain FIST